MAERSFTDLEIRVLKRFFTGVDTLSNIYAVKSSMPHTIWAFLTGSYSRSHLTMREKFLSTLEELDHAAYQSTLELMAGSSEDDLYDDLLKRADKFLSVWAVQYGHNSLKDSCTDRFAIENISIRATKFIEWVALGAYQEKSTRYADFSNVQFIVSMVPDDFVESSLESFEQCLEAYKLIFAEAQSFYMKDLEIEDPRVLERTARAKAFDIARYILPVNVPTSVGVTIPSRASEDLIRWLLSSPYSEAVDIGKALLECGSEVNPSLIKHVEPTTASFADHPAFFTFSEDLLADELEVLRKNVIFASVPTKLSDDRDYVTLSTAPITSPMHPRWLATASLIKERLSIDTLSLIEVAQGLMDSPHLVERALELLMVKRGPHQAVSKALGVGELLFSGTIDFGAYRDLQRHRRGFQIRVSPTTSLGFEIPEFIESRDNLKTAYVEAIARLERAGSQLVEETGDPTLGEYFTVLAHNVNFTYACSVEQFIYLVELRTGPAGHISYRKFAQAMATCVFEVFPELAPYVNVCWDGNSDRRQQEANTQKKLDSISSGKVA